MIFWAQNEKNGIEIVQPIHFLLEKALTWTICTTSIKISFGYLHFLSSE